MTTFAYQVSQVVNNCTVIALPSGSGVYGDMYQLQRADTSTFYSHLSAEQDVDTGIGTTVLNGGFEVNVSNPLPVNVVTGGGGGGIGTTTTPNISTLSDPTTPTHQAAVLAPGSSGSYALSIQGVTSGTAIPVSATFWQATQPVSGTVTANAGTGFPALYAAGGAVSGSNVLTVQGAASGVTLPVSGTFWQSTQPVSGTFWQSTQPVSGTVTANAGTGFPSLTTAGSSGTNLITVQGSASGIAIPVSGTFWQSTQPVSAASLPLPTGAATAAKQPALGTAGTPSADVITVQGATSMTALQVTAGGKTVSIEVTPTISTSAYVANYVTGGILTFSAAFLTAGSGEVVAAYIRSKSVQTAGWKLHLFKTSPVSGTYTDHAAATWNATDLPRLVAVIPISNSDSTMGTYTMYRSDAINAVIAAGATTLYAILTTTGTPTFASTTDITVGITVIQD